MYPGPPYFLAARLRQLARLRRLAAICILRVEDAEDRGSQQMG